MSLFLIISFGVAIQAKFRKWLRIFAGCNVLLLFIAIRFSQVRQGLLTSILGLVIVITIWLYQKNRTSAYLVSGFSVLALMFAVAGMLRIGPFSQYFYKASVTFRGDYWRAGWRMFIHHPVFGVGLDRYGAYFRQYRDATQAVRRGPDLISNAAHNVPLQLAATGGLFVLISFIALTVFIFARGIIAIRKFTDSQQILAGAIFAAWIAYEAQSMISIDNIGIATWGYILGGAVVGISVIPASEQQKIQKIGFQPMLSYGLLIIPLVLSVLLFKSESAAYRLQSTQITGSNIMSTAAVDLLKKPLAYGLQEPNFQIIVAGIYANNGKLDIAKGMLEKVHKADPTNYFAIAILSRIAEVQKQWNVAIDRRTNLLKIDPFNSSNLLSLGEDKKMAGDLIGARKVVAEIDAIDPKGDNAKKAHTEFAG